MKYRVVIGDARQMRGVIEVEAHSYSITELGLLVIFGIPSRQELLPGTQVHQVQPIVTYAAGAWRSIVDVEGFRKALQPGSVSDEASRTERMSEDPRRRPAQRSA